MDLVPTFLAAVLGGAGALGLVQWIATLTLRGRLHTAIKQNSEALDAVDDEHARRFIRQALITDSLKLASLSVSRAAPAAGGWVGGIVYMAVVLAIAFTLGWWLTGWDFAVLEASIAPLVIALFSLMLVPYAVISTTASRRRGQYLQAALALAETQPTFATADVRTGRKLIWRRSETRRARRRRIRSMSASDWTKARRTAIRRDSIRSYVWPFLPSH